MPALKIEFVYAGIRVRSMARSLRFYRRLGFRLYRQGRMEHRGHWAQLVYPGAVQRIELNFYPKGSRFAEPIRRGTEFDHFGFRVSSVSAMERRLEKLGFPIAARVRETHENLLYIQDPDGNWIEFFGPVEPPRKPSA